MHTLFARIGDSAKNAFHSNPTNTVFDAKRLIGCKMHDDDLKRDMKHWPFSVKEKGGKPVITVRYQSENREFVGFFFRRADSLVFFADGSSYQRLPKKSAPWFSAR